MAEFTEYGKAMIEAERARYVVWHVEVELAPGEWRRQRVTDHIEAERIVDSARLAGLKARAVEVWTPRAHGPAVQ